MFEEAERFPEVFCLRDPEVWRSETLRQASWRRLGRSLIRSSHEELHQAKLDQRYNFVDILLCTYRRMSIAMYLWFGWQSSSWFLVGLIMFCFHRSPDTWLSSPLPSLFSFLWSLQSHFCLCSRLLFVFLFVNSLRGQSTLLDLLWQTLKMAATNPPLPICTWHTSHCKLRSSSLLLESGLALWLTWLIECGRKDIVLALSPAFKRSESFPFPSWIPVPCKKSHYPETTMF